MARPVGHPDGSLIAGIASDISWANTKDRAERTAPGRQAFRNKFVDQARELYGELPDDELERRAEFLRRAYFRRLALRSAQARRERKSKSSSASSTTSPAVA